MYFKLTLWQTNNNNHFQNIARSLKTPQAKLRVSLSQGFAMRNVFKLIKQNKAIAWLQKGGRLKKTHTHKMNAKV